jgi:hypothetical protein
MNKLPYLTGEESDAMKIIASDGEIDVKSDVVYELTQKQLIIITLGERILLTPAGQNWVNANCD